MKQKDLKKDLKTTNFWKVCLVIYIPLFLFKHIFLYKYHKNINKPDIRRITSRYTDGNQKKVLPLM